MNRLILSFITYFLTLTNPIFAEENLRLTIGESQIANGDTISICLDNEKDYAGFQFDMELPKGVIIKKYEKDSKRIPESTILRKEMIDEEKNCYRFIAYGKTNIFGKSGEAIIKITISIADEEDVLGKKSGKFKNIKFSDAKGEDGYKSNSEMPFDVKVAKDVYWVDKEPGVIEDCVYDGSSKRLIKEGTGTIEGGTLLYSLDGGDYTEEVPKGEEAKTYTINYKVIGDDKHKDIPCLKDPQKVTITAKELLSPNIIIDPSYPLAYNGKEKKPSIIVKDGDVVIDPKEYKDPVYSNNKNAGTATVTIMDKDGGNYIVNGSKDFTITPAEGSYTKEPTAKNITYNGTNQELINKGATNSGTIYYWLEGEEHSTNVPTGNKAGDYKVFFEIKGNSNYNDVVPKSIVVTIATKTVSNPSITLSEKSYTYDGKKKEPTVILKTGNDIIPESEYTVTYNNNIDAGTAQVNIKDNNGGNYDIKDTTKTYQILKAEHSFTNPKIITDLKYSRKLQDLIIGASSDTGTPLYSTNGTDYSENIPQGVDAQTYTIYFKINENNNYNAVKPQTFKVTIAAKELSSPNIIIDPIYNLTYDGKEKKPSITVKDGDVVIDPKEYKDPVYSNNKNAGTATVTIMDKDGGNYIVNGSKDFTITPAEGSFTKEPTAKNITYNGTDQELINKGTTKSGTIYYWLEGKEHSENSPTGNNAGDYKVFFEIKGNSNYNDVAPKSIDVTIAPKTVSNPSISLSEKSYTYDGKKKEPTVILKTGNDIIPESEYTVTYSNNIDAGTAQVNITDNDGGNYIVNGSTTFTIKQAESQLVDPTAKTDLVYSGVSQNLINSGSSTTGIINYSLDAKNYSTTIPKGTNAGSYTIYYKLEGDKNHTNLSAKSFKVTIAKATISASVDNYTINMGDDIPTFTINYNGFVNQENVEAFSTAPKASCKATKNSEAGEYEITLSGGKANNYDFSYTSGKLIIKPVEFVNKDENNNPEGTYTITSKQKKTATISDDTGISGGYTIPESIEYNGTKYTVTEIAANAFENNTGLTEVIIPKTITSIGSSAFAGCSNLKSITVYIPTPLDLTSAAARAITTRANGSSIFDGVNKETCILYVLESSLDLYKAAPVWRDFKDIRPLSSSGINDVISTDNIPFDVYNIRGQKVKSKATDLQGLPLGIYVINGKKVVLNRYSR